MLDGLFTVGNFLIALDLLIVTYLLYRVLLLIRGTRAVQMLVGLALIIVLYFFAKFLHLATLQWLLGHFLSSLILVVIVIFQEEIRRGLTKVGIKPIFFGGTKTYSDEAIKDLAQVADSLSKNRIGALIVLQREVGLDEFLEDAVLVDAALNRKLLISIFQRTSPLHDGAVVIEDDRIKAAGCLLPLSFDPDLDPNLGTRHRAALGLSERSDAVILVISEESGSISLVHESKLYRNLDLAGTQERLATILDSSASDKVEQGVA